jgi:hypothetical protein
MPLTPPPAINAPTMMALGVHWLRQRVVPLINTYTYTNSCHRFIPCLRLAAFIMAGHGRLKLKLRPFPFVTGTAQVA